MHGTHLVNHILHPELQSNNILYVIGVCSNPARYQSRYRLARDWMAEMSKTPNVQMVVVEAAFGDRQFEITDPNNPWHLQLRINQEIWIKEAMINLGVRELLPKDWKYVAWLDMDISFLDNSWAQETLHQLQHFDILQPWSDCIDLNPLGGVTQHFKSFGLQHQRGVPKQRHAGETYYSYAHSGFAWACTRSFWENTQPGGGLMTFPILGSADHHQAWACISQVDETIHKGMTPSFFRRCYEWQRGAVQICHNQVGFVPGTIKHNFHGPKKLRYYRERWQILVDDKFDPDKQLMTDSQGLPKLVGNDKLLHDIHLYNIARQEDNINEY